MALDEKHFRLALSHFASGVTVVTTSLHGEPYGMTVASFASLSLRPPLVLICIENSVRTHQALAAAGKFAVNILSESQEDISSLFASRIENKFEEVAFSPGELGLPLIDGCIAAIECNIVDTLPGGDHTIFVGEVVAARMGEGNPLLYFRSGYGRMA